MTIPSLNTRSERGEQAPYDFRGVRKAIIDSDMTGNLKLVALVLLTHMPRCFPGVATIADECSVDRKTVMRAMSQLEALKVVRVSRRNGCSNTYEFQNQYHWGTGTREGLVPRRDQTSTTGGTGPVPLRDPTSPMVGPKEDPKTDLQTDPKRREGTARLWPPSKFAPEEFEPDETHRVRCQELALETAELLRAFKAHEFNREYSDWPRRFSKWIEDEKLKRETESAKGRRKDGPNQPNCGMTGLEIFDRQRRSRSAQPNLGRTGFESIHLQELREEAEMLRAAGADNQAYLDDLADLERDPLLTARVVPLLKASSGREQAKVLRSHLEERRAG